MPRDKKPSNESATTQAVAVYLGTPAFLIAGLLINAHLLFSEPDEGLVASFGDRATYGPHGVTPVADRSRRLRISRGNPARRSAAAHRKPLTAG